METRKDPEYVRRENEAVLHLLQAMIGLVSSNMIAISLMLQGDKDILLRFYVEEQSEETDEDVDDIIFDMDALIGDSDVGIGSEIVVGRPLENRTSEGERMVYWKKDELPYEDNDTSGQENPLSNWSWSEVNGE